MNLKKVISACTASMLGLSYLCSAFTVAAAEKKENLLVLGDASSKGYEHSKTIVDIIEDKLDVKYDNLSVDASTTTDMLKSVKENIDVISGIKNSDSVVISAGAYDYLTEIMKVVADYTDYGDSVQDVRKKMIDDVANSSQKIMDPLSSTTTTALNNIKETVNEIKAINPDTEVYIVSLYNPFKYDVEKYGVTNDPIIDAVSQTVNSTLDTFNENIADFDGVYKIMDTNKAFNKLAKKYAHVTGDATGLSVKEQFDLATKVLAEITGETPASALNKVLSRIPAYLLPLLPDNFTVNPMTFDLGEATYDIASNAKREVSLDLSLVDNFGISAFQGDLTIGTGKEGFVCTDVFNDAYKGMWSVSKDKGTIQFVSESGHNIEATDKVFGSLDITIPADIKPGEYDVTLSNASISVLTSKGQKTYKETEGGIIKLAAGKIIIKDSSSENPETTITSGPIQTDVTTTTSGPNVTGVTTTTSGPNVTGVTTTTTGPDLPPVSGPVKSLKVPVGQEAQDMVSQVPYAQFYYSYDTKQFDLEGLKVEAQSYNEKGEAVTNGAIDITSFVDLKNNTATPKSTFDLASKKLIYNVPLVITPDKVEDGKQLIYVKDKTDATKGEYFDVTELKKAFDGVTFKAYIGLRGDIDLNFKVDTRDGSAVIKKYNAVSLGDASVISQYTAKYIDNSGLKLNAEETKTLEQFTYFLGDASNNSNSDHSAAKYGIDTRDETFIIKFYNEYNMALVDGDAVDESEIWKTIEGNK